MSERRGEIQWLRAVAALEVVVVHSDLTTKHIADGSVLRGWYAVLGGIGVELFFVVSGFVICLTASRARSAGSFLLGRVRRIMPLCALFTTVAAAIHLTSARYLIAPADIGPRYLVESYLLLPQWRFPIVGPCWTLEHEMLFYEIVAAALLLGALTPRLKLAVGAFVVALGCLGSARGHVTDGSVWLAHLASPYMLAFGFGWLLRCCEEHDTAPRLAIVAACLAVLALAVASGDAWSHHLLLRILLAAVLFRLALAARRPLSAGGRLDRLGWLNRGGWLLGDASFSLYLTHWFVLSAIGKVAGRLGVPEVFALPLRLGAILLAVAIGLACYRLVERPLGLLLRAPGGVPKTVPLVLP